MGLGVVVVRLCAKSWGFWLVVFGLVKRGGGKSLVGSAGAEKCGGELL